MQISSLKLYRWMQRIACICNFQVRNIVLRCDLKQHHFTKGSCSIPGFTTWWSRPFSWDKIRWYPQSVWQIWWYFVENLVFKAIFKVQFVLPSSIFASFTSHRSRGVVVCWSVSFLIRAFQSLRPMVSFLFTITRARADRQNDSNDWWKLLMKNPNACGCAAYLLMNLGFG